jgi:hypothetical protein
MKIILLALLLTGCAVNEDQRELDIFMSELKVKERSLPHNFLKKTTAEADSIRR